MFIHLGEQRILNTVLGSSKLTAREYVGDASIPECADVGLMQFGGHIGVYTPHQWYSPGR